MRIVNETLLASFRLPGRCEYCGRTCHRREAHHVIARGMGGGRRLDVRLNLVSLGSTELMLCPCHRMADGEIHPSEFWAIIAQRERCLQSQIKAILDLFVRLVKPTASQLRAELSQLPMSTQALARRELEECGILEAA